MKIMVLPSAKQKARISSLDLMKLFGILIVMMGHCIRKFVGVDFLGSPLNDYVWLSEMPIFFLAAGYVHTKENKLNRWYLLLWGILKKALWYLWPIITYSLIRVYCFGQYDDFPNYYYHFINNPSEGLWFFFILYWIVTIFDIGTYFGHFFSHPIAKAFCPFLTSVIADIVLSYMVGCKATDGVFLGTALFTRYSTYYLAGYGLFSLYQSSFAKTKAFSRIEIGAGLTCLGVFIGIPIVFPHVFYWDLSSSNMQGWSLIGGLSASLFFFLLCRFLCRARFFRILSTGGRYSGAAYWAQPNLILWWTLWKTNDVGFQYLSGFALEGLVIAFLFGAALLSYWIPFCYYSFFFRPQSHYTFEKRWLFAFL